MRAEGSRTWLEGAVKLLYTRSLARTLEATGDALLLGRSIPAAEARRVADWLAPRQGITGSYAGMFAPTPKDFADGIRLLTGERIGTRAATAHILGEEACRALLLLAVDSQEVRQALSRATRSMDARLRESEVELRRPGFY
jgi:hypothetical protein